MIDKFLQYFLVKTLPIDMDRKGRTNRRSNRLNQKKRKRDDHEEDTDTSDTSGEKELNIDPSLLAGLSVKNGEYVRIDQNLLKRLKPAEKEPVDPMVTLKDLFVDCPEYADLLSGSKPLTADFIAEASAKFGKNHWGKKMAEMVANLPLEFLALERSAMKDHNFEYRYKPPVQPRVTDQYHSGRCWLFASLNALRYGMQFKYGLEHKFEFSPGYLFFWDKIERANVFLEGIWALRDRPLDDRYLQMVFTDPSSHMIQDGGYWLYFKNLVMKYGLVPKTVYEDSYNCLVSDYMNDALVCILNQMALDIRETYMEKDWTREDFDVMKKDCMKTIYDLVVRFMGEPPKKFDWQYKDSADEYHEVKDLTPEKFFRVLVPHQFESKMTFIHDPRYPEHYYKPYHVEYATNMVGADTIVFVNLPLDVFKRAIAESQMDGEPCWFACDVGASLDFENGTMDTERFDYKRVLGVDTRYAKSDMMWMKTSVPSHAMVIAGVDMDEPRDGHPVKYTKWRVENSWGIQCEMEWHPDHGCWQMSDEWFDQHVFMAVIDLKYFEEETFQNIMEHSKDIVVVKPWDVFGTVATHSGCSHCQHKVPMRKKFLPKNRYGQ